MRAHTPYSLITLECLVNLWDVHNFGACQDRSKSSQIQWSRRSTDPSVFTAGTCYNRGQEPAEGGVGVGLGQQVLPFLGQVDFFLFSFYISSTPCTIVQLLLLHSQMISVCTQLEFLLTFATYSALSVEQPDLLNTVNHSLSIYWARHCSRIQQQTKHISAFKEFIF